MSNQTLKTIAVLCLCFVFVTVSISIMAYYSNKQYNKNKVLMECLKGNSVTECKVYE